jgi:hypothetical protein
MIAEYFRDMGYNVSIWLIPCLHGPKHCMKFVDVWYDDSFPVLRFLFIAIFVSYVHCCIYMLCCKTKIPC